VVVVNMQGNRPDVTDEEIGMRTFQLRKARAIERAMERLREGMKDDYASLAHAEIEALSWIFGELWAYVARTDWDDLHFSKLSIADVRTILNHAREITNHTRNSVEVLSDVYDVVVSKS
jgi:hypothetical protein